MNKRITITVGVSGSGKSTWAHEEWQKNPMSTLIVNRDSIRQALFGYTESNISEYYKGAIGKLEKQVTKYEDVLIHEGLNEGKHVIVDATHLKVEYIERFEFWNVPTTVEWFDVKLKEALTRDMGRVRQVGEEIISKQYSQYITLRNGGIKDFEVKTLNLDSSLRPVYLLDIDGTIAHINGKRSPFEWSKVGLDDLDTSLFPVIEAINYHYSERYGRPKIIVVSGRDEVCSPETIAWLSKNNVDFEEIYMRSQGDFRPDWQVKEEIWRDIATRNNIVGLFDDRLQVVRRARALGLKVFNVEYNNF